MKQCNDCIHYEVCAYHVTEETDMTVQECELGFKDKASYIEQRVGAWVYGEYDTPHCSECGHEPKEITPFCPICGTNMEGGE